MPGTISRGRGRRTMNEINMVPFIDVMLVLLIIFMVTAPMVTPSLIDLPSVGKAGRQPDKIIQVVIGKDERLEVKGGDSTQQVSQRELAAAVKRAQGEDTNAPVVISADRNVKYETVVKAMDALQRAGVARVGLSVQLGGQ
ncbi:protein TolR [Pseudorhodoferax sp. Leaf274]|uniref:protein TolR n=1 Tax=Pseudorhodoferax sp. Leaf274 TaxID=1736318 RepID=UPI000702B333|nr:protein TolR [Pseudorhodoferax sp. Leaf274]KQP35760.1 protein TolR [Pseudorhodoferax sp. Leaf274]